MEYYWELRSKNAQNIKALMYPLYSHIGVNYCSCEGVLIIWREVKVCSTQLRVEII